VNKLAGVFQPHEGETDEELSEHLQPPAQPVIPIQPVPPKEIKAEIGRLHFKKSPGMDLITPTMLKKLPHKGIIPLTYLFNAILRHQYWPHSLNLADITLIHKTGKDSKEVKSYRPISLPPILAKLLEKTYSVLLQSSSATVSLNTTLSA
jgi:hypothetical protein